MSDDQTIEEQLQQMRDKLHLVETLKTERDISDSKYAAKVIERIVFGVIILFALAALFFIFTKVGLPNPSL